MLIHDNDLEYSKTVKTVTRSGIVSLVCRRNNVRSNTAMAF